MNKFILSIALLLLAGSAQGATDDRKPCEELKAEIAAQLDAKGVKAYTLEIVDKDQATQARVVGRCEGGTKRVVYTRK